MSFLDHFQHEENEILSHAGIPQHARSCGTTTLVTPSYMTRLFCGRKDCPQCYNWRVGQVSKKLSTGQIIRQEPLYANEIDKGVKSAILQKLYRSNEPYLILPQAATFTLIVFETATLLFDERDDFVELDNQDDFLRAQLQTPDGERISFSRNWPRKEDSDALQEKEEVSKEKYWININIAAVADLVEKVGASVTWTKDYNTGKYDVDTTQWDCLVIEMSKNASMLYKIADGVATKVETPDQQLKLAA